MGNNTDLRDQEGEFGGDALRASWLIQEEASALGFDWPDISGVFAKLHEELGEIQAALAQGDPEGARRELGDVLFAAVNLARFLGADPGAELARCNDRFSLRFGLLKDELKSSNIDIQHCSLAELDVVWERVKKNLENRT